MTLTYAELFAGAGGLSRGLEAAGFHCVAHAEIEPHARAVLRYRWPDTRLDGDVTQIDGRDYAGITLLSGGSPCQDLSVAGKRAGLTGSRSSLFHEQCRIWQESGAPYLLWENVHGAFSSNGGKDFATVLSTLVGATIPVPADGWSSGGVAAGRDAVAAWRVLDLQHVSGRDLPAPPQRRVRVFVLAARASGVDPAEVLALAEGVCGHPSPREQAREGVAGRAAGGVGAGGVVGTLGTRPQRSGPEEAASNHNVVTGEVLAFDSYNQAASHVTSTLSHGESGRPIAFHHTQDPISGDVAPAIGRTTDGMGVMAFDTTQITSPANYSNPKPGDPCHPLAAGAHPPAVVCTTGDITHALTHEGADASEDGTGRGTPIVARLVAFGEYATDGTASTIQQRDYKSATDHEVCGTLDFGGHGGSYNGQDAYQGRIRAAEGRPRRLTPKECERLMSWPDDWTRTGRKEDGTVYELSDTARYRLCGNGVGSVCVEWIAQRLADAIAQRNGHPMQEAA